MKFFLRFGILLFAIWFLSRPGVFAQAQSGAQSSAQPNLQSGPQAPCDCAQVPTLMERLEFAHKILTDWPDLARYRDADSQLAPAVPGEARVVFMGDSITDFWSDPKFGGFFPGKPYVNRGISGQTTPQMLVRFRPDVIALQPKVVVILAGTNDLAGNTGPEPISEIEDNFATMAELAAAHKIHVVLASLLPVSDYGHNREGKPLVMTDRRPPARILELNAWLKQHASENGYTYLDYFSSMVDDKGFFRSDLSDDGLHPNAKGYAVMAPLAEQAIRASLKRKR
jgi:lysophospholipase L1-like esterase